MKNLLLLFAVLLFLAAALAATVVPWNATLLLALAGACFAAAFLPLDR